MTGNPFAYNSRTYLSTMNDINSDATLASKPEWFKRMIAGLGDLLSMIENATANQSFLRTAFTRQAVQDLLALIDYQLVPQSTSSGICLFYLDGAGSGTGTFTASDLKGSSVGSLTIPALKFESRTGYVMASTTGTFTWAGSNNNLTVASDFLYTGQKIRFTTTITLPTGLLINTDYYVIYGNATTIKVATSITNAFAGTAVTISDAGSGVHTWQLFSFPIACYQQDTKTNQIIGQSDGSTQFQQFDLLDKFIIPATLQITIASVLWSLQTTLVNSTALDTHFKTITKSEGYLAIEFGNGTYGAIPSATDIYADYAVGGGANSNISSYNYITTYTGGNVAILGITNPTYFTGGADEQNLELAKTLGTLLLKARDRAITQEDISALALAYGGLSLIQVNKNFYGVLSAQIVAIASGGGNPSSPLRTAIQTYLIARTPLEEMNIVFDTATLTTVTVTSATHLKTGYTWALVLPYLTLAWKLFFTETAKEILDEYLNNGINDAITLINTIFSTTFTYANDGVAIQKLMDQLNNFGYRDFNDTIQESDAYAFLQNGVSGIDYITIASPSFPIVLGVSEITSHNGSVFNLTQI